MSPKNNTDYDAIRNELKGFYPIVEDMSDEDLNDWLAERYEQYKSETPEEYEEHVR